MRRKETLEIELRDRGTRALLSGRYHESSDSFERQKKLSI